MLRKVNPKSCTVLSNFRWADVKIGGPYLMTVLVVSMQTHQKAGHAHVWSTTSLARFGSFG